MADSFLADLWLALLRASDGDTQRAQAALDYLRNEAPRGRGLEPGWRGRVFLPTDKTATKERHQKILQLRGFGFTCAEIAEMVHMGEGSVRNFLSRRRRHGRSDTTTSR